MKKKFEMILSILFLIILFLGCKIEPEQISAEQFKEYGNICYPSQMKVAPSTIVEYLGVKDDNAYIKVYYHKTSILKSKYKVKIYFTPVEELGKENINKIQELENKREKMFEDIKNDVKKKSDFRIEEDKG